MKIVRTIWMPLTLELLSPVVVLAFIRWFLLVVRRYLGHLRLVVHRLGVRLRVVRVIHASRVI